MDVKPDKVSHGRATTLPVQIPIMTIGLLSPFLWLTDSLKNMRDYVILRFISNGKKHAVRLTAAKLIEDEEVVITRSRGLYYVILPGIEIGMSRRVLLKLIELARHAMEQEKWV